MDTLQNLKKTLATANKDIIAFLNGFVDAQSFVETDAYICSQTAIAEAVGEGVVSGFASVADTGVCVFALNSKVLKGAVGEANAKKIVRTINNAVRMNKPLIAVWDTQGARFAEGIGALEGYGSILRAYTVAYGEVPIISVIKGSNLGISSYVAGLSDFVIAYPDSVIASGSPLVFADKNTGSLEAAVANGLVTNTVKNEKQLRDTISAALSVFSCAKPNGDDTNRVCKGLKDGCTPDALIKEVFDKNSYLPVRDGFAPCVKTGFATLGEVGVGVVATDRTADGGRLTADGCVKICEFLNVCQNAELPVVFLVDSVGTARSDNDAAFVREMSDLIFTVNTQDVDMFSVVYGKAIGGAYSALVAPCEYKIAWESAEVGALESEAAARLLFADEIKAAKDKDKAAQKLAESYGGDNCSAIALAKKGYFDNVIEPNLTRSYLLAALLAHVE